MICYFFGRGLDLCYDALFIWRGDEFMLWCIIYLEGSWINVMMLYLFRGELNLSYDAL